MFFNSIDSAIFLPVVFLLYWIVISRNHLYKESGKIVMDMIANWILKQ